MPTKRRSKRTRSPNVYRQAEREQEEIAHQAAAEVAADAGSGDGDGQPAGPVRRRGSGSAARSRVGRMTQTTRSDVYAATIPSELRKMGVLAGGVVVALVVFSVVLG